MALALDVVVVVAPALPSLPTMLVQEVTLATVEVSAPDALASPVVAPLSTIVAPLLSVGVVTMSAPVMSPSLSSTPLVPPPTVLASTLTSTSYHPYVCLDHVYTSNDVDSL